MASHARRNEPEPPTYEGDVAAWALSQSEILETLRPDGVDWSNIAEELRDLAAAQFKAYVSALQLVIEHMLKWDMQPERRGNSWAGTIAIQRDHAQEELQANPSFKSRREEALATAWRRGRSAASSAMDIPMRDMPKECLYGWEDLMNRRIEWHEQ